MNGISEETAGVLIERIHALLLMEELARIEPRLEMWPQYLPKWVAALSGPYGSLSHGAAIAAVERLVLRRDAILAELGWLA